MPDCTPAAGSERTRERSQPRFRQPSRAAFIACWQHADGPELANYQLFVSDLCQLLEVPLPDPARDETRDNAYVFERRVTFRHGDGSSSIGRIDCYRRNAWVLEAKKIRLGARGKGFDDAMQRARGQAEGYARALPAEEGRQANMTRVQCSVPERVSLSRRSPAHSSYGIVIPYLRSLLIAWLLVLTGCAAPDRARDLAPPVEIPESTWWRVDNDIAAASLAATGPARNYARREMESWRGRVQARTESDFIPWFTDYWTQQWLAIKVAWYKLGADEGTDPAVDRLASYLQDQYGERVLAPVAREIDPDVVRSESTLLYIQILRERLQGIPWRYGVPEDRFARRLEEIPAIALSPPPAHSASLDQIVRADPIDRLPAFVALNARFSKALAGGGAVPSNARISPVARRASESLVARLGVSVGAGAAAAVVGGVAGMAISLGAAGFGAIAHEKERPAMEAQLRESLNAALGDMWQSLMEDTAGGVMAGVHHICGQIEGALARTSAQAVELDPLPREMPLPADPPFGEEEGQGGDATDDR